jgi:hypothetical protein
VSTAESTGERLCLDSHPASTALLRQIVRGRSLAGYEPDEWGVWVTWPVLEAGLVPSERAACELARALAAIESCGGVPPRVAPIAREAAMWALGGEA